MKKNNLIRLIVLLSLVLLSGCNLATPENYFDRAVLNCNMMTGFATEGQRRELEQPSAKLVPGTKDQTEPMKRKEVIERKITYLEGAYTEIKNLRETEDTREMLHASIALYDYVFPVYKSEYRQLAKLYDDGAPKEQIASFAKSISDKYFAGYADRLDKVTDAGKPYAAKHNIIVNWGVKTSP